MSTSGMPIDGPSTAHPSSSRPQKRARAFSDLSSGPDLNNLDTVMVKSPPAPKTVPMDIDPPPQKEAPKPKKHTVSVDNTDLSVFDVLNIFCCHWFLSRASLVANAISAQKVEDGQISWVEFAPPYHAHLVKCGVALVPRRISVVKKVIFIYILELLNGKDDVAFFELQKGGHKVNNAQKEKHSRAAKQECVRDAAKVAKLLACERQCLGCRCKFESRKSACKHKCKCKAKVVHIEREVAAIEEHSLWDYDPLRCFVVEDGVTNRWI